MKTRKTGQWVDWGHLLLLIFICGVVVAYLLDARAVSLKVSNLALIQPAAILALILAAMVLPQCFRRPPEDDTAEGAEEKVEAPKETWRDLGKVAALAAAFGAFALSLEAAGFDVATFIFVALGLWICGERRYWVIGLYSAVFTVVIVYGYQLLVPYPFPLLVL
jgi:hypothetical protein